MAGQLWVTDSLGGYMHSLNLSKKLRMAVQPLCKFRQFADIKDATQQGRHKGATFHWNVFSDLSTAGTTLTETSTMPETNFTISQGTLTINEYGNSVPYTGKLDDLSEQPVTEIIHKALKHDAKKALDKAAAAQFDATPLRVASTATDGILLTTNGTATATTDQNLTSTLVKLIVDQMKERDIPAYDGNDYYAIARPNVLRPLKNNLESIQQYTERGLGMIMTGEVGRYEGVRFVEQTSIGDDGIGTPAATWNKTTTGWALFFGEDTVAEAVAVPEEVRGKIPSDYGRSMGVAWYYLGGFGLSHTAAAQARVIMWDSAA